MKAKNLTHYLMKLSLSGLLFSTLMLTASASTPASPVPKEAYGLATSLKELEGFYQLPNKVAYLRIVARQQDLFAVQVWDNKEYSLLRKGDLAFESKDEEYKLEFLKNETGAISGAKILNRVILKKVGFDPTKDATLTNEQLKKLDGKYQFQKDKSFFIEIRASNNILELKQLWDGKIISFSPKSELDFFNKEKSFPIQFIIKNGIVTQAVCFADDVWDRIKN